MSRRPTLPQIQTSLSALNLADDSPSSTTDSDETLTPSATPAETTDDMEEYDRLRGTMHDRTLSRALGFDTRTASTMTLPDTTYSIDTAAYADHFTTEGPSPGHRRFSTSACNEPHPTLETVTQPGVTLARPPANLKARLKEVYDAIAPVYNEWSALHRNQRSTYSMKLVDLMEKDIRELNEATDSPTTAARRVEETLEKFEEEWPGATRLGASPPPTKVDMTGLTALEVGCGMGLPVVQVLTLAGIQVIGVDLSGHQLTMANNHFRVRDEEREAWVTWAQKDMMELRYPANEFAAIVALFTLLHLPREEQTVFLHRCKRWLRPGGFLLINFPQDEIEGEEEENWLGQDKGWMYTSSWGERKTLRVLDELDFEILVQDVKADEDHRTGKDVVWVIARLRGGWLC